MKLTFLGTGTAWSRSPMNHNNNALVRASEEHEPWLIDCGTTAPQALYELGMTVSDFAGVLVTHLHGDHVFGLEETGFYNYFVRGRRVHLWLPENLLSSVSGIEGEDLWENCLRGPMGTVQLLDGSTKDVGLEDYFIVHFLRPGEPTVIEGVEVEIFEVEHVPNKPSYGVILDRHVAYTSDCRFSQERIEWLLGRGCDTIYHDTYFGPAMQGRVHTAFVELQGLPRELVEHIVLMHYNDDASAEAIKGAKALGFRLAVKAEPYEHGEMPVSAVKRST